MKPLVIGIGNEYRRDDGAALEVVRRLRPSGVRCLEESGEGAQLLERWKGADAVVLIDAVRSGAEPGTIHRFDAAAQPLPAAQFRGSTHAFSLAQAIELSRVLGELPRRVVVFGIEGKNFESGAGLSPEVEGALDEVARRVRSEVSHA